MIRIAAGTIVWLRKSRRKLATVAAGMLALSIAVHVVFGANGMVAYSGKRGEHTRLRKEIDDIQKENDRLNQRIKALKTDPKTIEKEAREQLRYARPGEVVYALPADAVPQSAATATATATAQK